MAISVPSYAIADAMQASGEFWPLLLAIAYYESTYNPQAVGDDGCSYGYLQFNVCGGLGVGHSIAELLDGPANMRLGAQYIGGKLAQGVGLWDALQPWSTRPSAYALYQRMLAEGIEGAGDVPPIDGGGPPVDGGGAPDSRGLLVGAGIFLAALVWLQ